ncbi:MAG: RtcB family protein [Candidatus ainarchaeum sp.]|nr:RtcB family protein [Candidatus ainarchaeum sp.]
MKLQKAKIFVKSLDEVTLNQFQNAIKYDFVVDSALMPDAHLGYVAPIGSVIKTKDCIVPSFVGYDVGCGVIAVKLKLKNIKTEKNKKLIDVKNSNLFSLIKKNEKKIFNEINLTVPMGLGKLHSENQISKETKEEFSKILKSLENKIDSDLFNWLKRRAKSNLGTLGQGNHFIEIGENKKDIYLIVHVGSRNVGHKVAEHYMQRSKEQNLLKIKTEHVEDVFPLKSSSKIGKEYLLAQDFCLNFALLNRMELIKMVIKGIEKIINQKIDYVLFANKNHNHVIREGKFFIHRKGATPAKKGEKGVIPANMCDGTYLIEGKGSKKFLYSSSHGAGRSKSKKESRETISLFDFKKQMKGIVANVRNETIDESPNAYKKIDEVLSNQKESIKIIKQIKPIINWKGF